MRQTKWLLSCAVLSLALLTVGCAKPPQQEMDAAKSAMSDAEQAGAPQYAADSWDKAQQAMNDANAEVEAQNAKFALFRSYKKSKDLLSSATTAANDAKQAATTAKEQAKSDAQSALDAAQASISQAESLMNDLKACRRHPKGFAQDMEQMQGTLDGLKSQATEVQSSMSSEDYMTAKQQAESLKSQADALATDLQNAKTKIGC